ncbi:MAG: hypothetical protein OEZ51_15305 [Nitrospinota bacterium]|nr:hypothetical protein [Nitrospinota bacterium]
MVQNDAETLMSEASRLLEEYEPEKALKIGKQLEKMRFSGAFEIQALAYADLDKKKKAIQVLEKGVKKAPDVWLLWQLLGNYYSDEGDLKKALTAFEKGLQTKQPDNVSLKYNYAIALQRQKKFKKAQGLISEILSDERYPDDIEEGLFLYIQGLRLSLLNDLKQYEETLKLFAELESIISQHENSQPSELSRIFDEVATAHWNLKNKDRSEAYLKKSIEYDKKNTSAQWLHREMHKEEDYSHAKYFRLIIEGIWHTPFEGETNLPGFFTNYDVIANDEEEALEIIKYFEPPEIHYSLKIADSEILKAPKQPKGVYGTMSYNFFPSE